MSYDLYWRYKVMFIIFRFFNWIGDITNTIILTPNPYAVGNAAEEIYFGLLKARRLQRRLIFLFPYELPWKLRFRLININLFDIDSKYLLRLPWIVNRIARLLITIIYGINKITGMMLRRILNSGLFRSDLYNIPLLGVMTLWQPRCRMADFFWGIVDAYTWPEQIKNSLEVRPHEKILESEPGLREKIGLPSDAWYVCLHVRESGFHNDKASERNASIANYIPAIKEITDRGGWVVRLGDPTMKKLPTLNQVIDYPFTSAKSPEMDMLLISGCSLYIGMTSGIYDLAILFGRPIILTNMSSWLFGLPPKKVDVCLLKHIYSKKHKRFLSVKEWLMEPWESMSYRTIGDNYILYENSKEEIHLAVKEYFNRCENWSPSSLQELFQANRIDSGKKILSKQIFAGTSPQQEYTNIVDNPFDNDFHLYDMLERYRLASRLESTGGLIDHNYLQANWDQDSMLLDCEIDFDGNHQK